PSRPSALLPSCAVADSFGLLGGFVRFDFMKAPGIVWPLLLTVTGLICWLSWPAMPQGPQARIRVEGDVTDLSMPQRSSPGCVAYTPYYFRENQILSFFIPASEQS
ncbi:MAG: hypothetical protein WBW41_15990, partial [Verrucomicrobiia bacterium]